MLNASFATVIDPWIVLVVCAAFVAGGTVKGILGIGLPLVALPICALVIPAPSAIALTIVPIVIANCWQVWDSGYLRAALRRFATLMLCMTLAASFSARWLTRLDDDTAGGVIGAMLVLIGLLQLTPIRLQIPAANERWTHPLAGVIGGAIGGASGIFSLIASYLLMLDLDKEQFVGTISLIYVLAGLVLYGALASHAAVGPQTLLYSALLTVPVSVGMALGRRWRRRLDAEHFRRILIAVLATIGLSLIYRAVL